MDIQQYKADRKTVKDRIHRAMALPESQFGESLFDELAHLLFEFQFKYDRNYRKLCHSKGVNPDSINSWKEIPAIPVKIFKKTCFFSGPESEIEAVFTTSGTTSPSMKGKSYFSSSGLSLMEHSITINASRMFFPDIDTVHILVLAPSPTSAPQMIMAWGMERLIQHFGTRQSGFLIDKGVLNVQLLVQKLRDFEEKREPVAIIGASFGFVNLIERLEKSGIRFHLPPGSRTMDAGGYKGKSRELTREELRQWIAQTFGVDPTMIVNLLGMTELSSQFYDDSIRNTYSGKPVTRMKQNQPWTKTVAIDPASGQILPHHTHGVLQHIDLANLETPMAVLTDDIGYTTEYGFEIIGRIGSDESRGCSLTVDELSKFDERTK